MIVGISPFGPHVSMSILAATSPFRRHAYISIFAAIRTVRKVAHTRVEQLTRRRRNIILVDGEMWSLTTLTIVSNIGVSSAVPGNPKPIVTSSHGPPFMSAALTSSTDR